MKKLILLPIFIERRLTTERIISDSTVIRYAETTERKPAIHILRQSAPVRY